MTNKSTLIILALVSFGLGVIADRFLFHSGEPSQEVIQKRFAPVRASTDNNEEAVQTRSREAGNEQENISRRQGAPSQDQENQDPIEQLIRDIDDDQVIDAGRVSSVLDRLPHGPKRRELIGRIAWHWGRKNPKAALAWADTLQPSEKMSVTGPVIHAWARSDPSGAANHVAQMPKSQRSLDWVHETAHIWAEQDRDAALAWAQMQTDVGIRKRALRGAVGSWAHSDAMAAGEFALAIENTADRHAVLETVARRWAEQSVADSLQWAMSLDGGNRDRATMVAFEEIARHDPRLAASTFGELSSSLSNGESRDGIHSDIAREVADRLALSNPNDAADWVLKLPEADHVRRHAVERVAERWASLSPEEAANWVLGLPENDHLQRHAVERVTERWLRTDSMAASEWISEMPEGEARDAAAGELVRYIARSDQFSAFSWATSVNNEGYRRDLMRDVLRRWQKTDPVAARVAVEGADVTPETRHEFNRILGVIPATEQSNQSN